MVRPLRGQVQVAGLQLADGRELALDHVTVLREGRSVTGYRLADGTVVERELAVRVTLRRRRVTGYRLADGSVAERAQVRAVTAAERGLGIRDAGGRQVPAAGVAIRDPQTGRIVGYYSEHGEAPGRWIGRGATEDLGLTGGVSLHEGRELYERLMAGHHPVTGQRLTRGQPGGARVSGWDLLFSAPKSVSLLHGLTADPVVRQAVEVAHDAAVGSALQWLEDQTSWARRGHVRGGPSDPYPDTSYWVRTRGLVAAAFTHRATRPVERQGEDPHLHTHVVAANVTHGVDGLWSALDGGSLLALSRAAGIGYKSELRARLSRPREEGGLGLAWTHPVKGISEIRGLDRRDWIETFSVRSAEAEAELEAQGLGEAVGTGPSAARDQAGHNTRRAKESGKTDAELAAEWAPRAAVLGLGPEQLRAAGGRGVPGPDQLTPKIATRLARELTEQCNVFSPADALAMVAGSSTQGLTVARAKELADELTHGATDEIVSLGHVRELGHRDVIRLANGKIAPIRGVLRGEAGERYTTREVIRLERDVVRDAQQRRIAGVGLAHPEAVAAALAFQPELGQDQVAMVAGLCTDGAGVTVVSSPAGFGKTAALRPATEAWEASGFSILATAVMAARAHELGAAVGLEPKRALTIAALRQRVEAPADQGGAPLPRGVVLLVDEVSVVDLRDLAALQRHVRAAKGKLVLVGDPDQLGAIGPSAPLRELPKHVPTYQLFQNRRQVEPWERDALRDLREGRADEAVASYDAHDRIVYAVAESREARAALIAQAATDYLAARDRGESIALMAATHRDRLALNAPIRAELIRRGVVSQEGLQAGKLSIASGDELQVLKNSPKLGLRNSDVVHVERIDPKQATATVRRSDGEAVELPRAFMAQHVQHGYAQTVHKAQGVTVDTALILADSAALSSQWGYTALTRGAHVNRLYFCGPPPVNRDHHLAEEEAPTPEQQRALISAGLSRDRSKELAVEVIAALDRGDRQGAVESLAATVAVTQTKAQQAEAEQAQRRQAEAAEEAERPEHLVVDAADQHARGPTLRRG
jgi:conjugative relaxase-like TrwC/TraI family protein